jgi:hypothetical protein
MARSISPDGTNLNPERLRCALDSGELTYPGRIGGIPNNGCSHHVRRDLLEKFRPFTAQTIFEIHKASGLTAWPGERIDQAGADRIYDVHEHDRQGAGSMLQRRHAQGAAGQKDVRRERDQFPCVSAIAVGIIFAPADVELHIAALAPTQLLQALLERRDELLTFRIVRSSVQQHADAPDLLGLLRCRRERPCAAQADSDNELASSHSPPRAETAAIQVATRTIKSGNYGGRNGVKQSSRGAPIPRTVCLTWVIRVRVRPAAAPAMSVMPRKRRPATKMRSVAMGPHAD